MLVAAHRHDGEPAVPVRPLRPGAEQRRLPAAAGAEMIVTFRAVIRVEAGDEIVPGDQWLVCGVVG